MKKRTKKIIIVTTIVAVGVTAYFMRNKIKTMFVKA